MSTNPRGFLDTRRWYVIECYDSRDDAIEAARKHVRAKSFGPNRSFRITKSDPGKWCVQHAANPSDFDRNHAKHYNKRMVEDENKQRRLDL